VRKKGRKGQSDSRRFVECPRRYYVQQIGSLSREQSNGKWQTGNGWLLDPNRMVLHRQRYCLPPLNAEFLFNLFMSPQNGDALVGDL
jgi:hypothetical protein